MAGKNRIGTEAPKEPVFTKDFTLLLLGNLLNAVVFYLLMTSIAIYAETRFGVTYSLAGFSVGAFLIGSIISRLFIGAYLERFGRRRMLFSALSVNLIMVSLYFFVSVYSVFVVLRICHGIAFGVVSTVYLTAGIDSLPVTRKGEGNGFFSLGIAFATAIGPFLGLYLVNNVGYHSLFVACVAFSAVGFCATIPAKIVEARSEDVAAAEKRASKDPVIFRFIERNALSVAAIMLVGGIAYSSVISFINAYAESLGMTRVASFFFLVYAAFLFGCRPAAGKIYDRRGENTVVVPSLLLYVGCFLFLGFAQSGWMLLAAALFMALGYGTLMPTFQSLVVRVSPPARIATAITTYYVFLDTGNSIGGYFNGALADAFGFRVMFLVVGALVLLMTPCYWLLHGRKARLRSETQAQRFPK